MKKNILFAFTVSLILLAPVLNVNASIHPIIITNMPDPMNVGILQNVNLSWVIIDDNPSFYELFINNTMSRNATIISNVITEPFSAPKGLYNLTLVVNDYSNNLASKNQIINVSGYATTINSNSASIYTSSTASMATSSFLYSTLLVTLVVFSFSKYLKSRREK